jgi:hypothetical protein
MKWIVILFAIVLLSLTILTVSVEKMRHNSTAIDRTVGKGASGGN